MDSHVYVMLSSKNLMIKKFQKNMDAARAKKEKEKEDAIREAVFKAARDQRDWADDVADFS